MAEHGQQMIHGGVRQLSRRVQQQVRGNIVRLGVQHIGTAAVQAGKQAASQRMPRRRLQLAVGWKNRPTSQLLVLGRDFRAVIHRRRILGAQRRQRAERGLSGRGHALGIVDAEHPAASPFGWLEGGQARIARLHQRPERVRRFLPREHVSPTNTTVPPSATYSPSAFWNFAMASASKLAPGSRPPASCGTPAGPGVRSRVRPTGRLASITTASNSANSSFDGNVRRIAAAFASAVARAVPSATSWLAGHTVTSPTGLACAATVTRAPHGVDLIPRRPAAWPRRPSALPKTSPGPAPTAPSVVASRDASGRWRWFARPSATRPRSTASRQAHRRRREEHTAVTRPALRPVVNPFSGPRRPTRPGGGYVRLLAVDQLLQHLIVPTVVSRSAQDDFYRRLQTVQTLGRNHHDRAIPRRPCWAVSQRRPARRQKNRNARGRFRTLGDRPDRYTRPPRSGAQASRRRRVVAADRVYQK